MGFRRGSAFGLLGLKLSSQGPRIRFEFSHTFRVAVQNAGSRQVATNRPAADKSVRSRSGHYAVSVELPSQAASHRRSRQLAPDLPTLDWP